MDEKNILVVDDDPSQLFAISRILRSAEYQVSEAATGEEGWEKVKKEHPDLVLLDVVLPDVNGREIAQRIKNDPELANVLIILISGIETSPDKQSQGLEEGADGYITRPISKRELLARIEALLRIRKAENKLRKSEALFHGIFDQSPIPILFYDQEAKLRDLNPAAFHLLGIKNKKDVMGLYLFDNPRITSQHQKTLHKEGLINFQSPLDFSLIQKMGFYQPSREDVIYLDWVISLLKGYGYLVMIQDITQQKKDQEKIEKNLKEKEMLLREIHHRVKNNLMVISSLLNLQSKYIKDQYSLDIFRESQNRARSMALIHEKLYQSTDLKRMDFGEYITNLTRELFHTYNIDPWKIKLHLKVENIKLDINTAIPLGLIVNELVTNSLKHAFPQDSEGNITIEFSPQEEEYCLIIADDGVGFPKDIDPEKTETLGLQLVYSLVQQINGTLELDKSPGTCYKIRFKETL